MLALAWMVQLVQFTRSQEFARLPLCRRVFAIWLMLRSLNIPEAKKAKTLQISCHRATRAHDENRWPYSNKKAIDHH